MATDQKLQKSLKRVILPTIISPACQHFLYSFCVLVYFVMDACFLCCVRFSFSVLSQDIGRERLQNDLFCVGLDVKH